MPKEAPSFSLAQYWDKRFQDNAKSFDWLLPESCFDEEIEAFRNGRSKVNEVTKDVLHIGPGTSMLSFHLKDLFGAEYQVHNVDFSHEAVEWGKGKENEMEVSHGKMAPMRWSQASLLSLPSILAVADPGSIELIVDKSTSDAIACGLDVRLRPSKPPTANAGDHEPVAVSKVHPLHILALNLAIITVPSARWLSLSYSKERYPFLPTVFAPFPDPLPDGVPNPNRYWKLRRQKEIQTEQEVSAKFRKAFDFVHRPVSSHHLYVLERTEERLDVEELLELGAQAEER